VKTDAQRDKTAPPPTTRHCLYSQRSDHADIVSALPRDWLTDGARIEAGIER